MYPSRTWRSTAFGRSPGLRASSRRRTEPRSPLAPVDDSRGAPARMRGAVSPRGQAIRANAVTSMTHHNLRPPLRLLLVTDGDTIPAWLVKSLESVERSGAATVALVLRTVPATEPGALFRLYQTM